MQHIAVYKIITLLIYCLHCQHKNTLIFKHKR